MSDQTDLVERLQAWVDALETTDEGWQECSDAVSYIAKLIEERDTARARLAEVVRGLNAILRTNYESTK